MKDNLIQTSFHILCAVAAVSLSIYWVYTYCLNEDLCKVDYKTYYDDIKDEYPALSMCFENFFSDDKLGLLPWKTNKSQYLAFLKGEFFEDSLLNINYRDVIRNISEIVVYRNIAYRNGSATTQDLITANQKNIFKESFVGSWAAAHTSLYHCYSLKFPLNKEIEYYEVGLKSSLFPNSSRATSGELITLIHYPNQIMISSETIRYTWPKRQKYDRFTMNFKVIGVEVIKRRTSGKVPCLENWKNYDDFVLVDHMKKVGCRVPYLPNIETIPLCNSQSLMQKSQFYLKRSSSDVSPPCKSMEKILYTYEEEEMTRSKPGQEGVFVVKLWFSDQQFKEITQTRYGSSYFLINC